MWIFNFFIIDSVWSSPPPTHSEIISSLLWFTSHPVFVGGRTVVPTEAHQSRFMTCTWIIHDVCHNNDTDRVKSATTTSTFYLEIQSLLPIFVPKRIFLHKTNSAIVLNNMNMNIKTEIKSKQEAFGIQMWSTHCQSKAAINRFK